MNPPSKWRQLFKTYSSSIYIPLFFAAALLPDVGRSQTLFWNPGAAGSGTWDTSSQNWSTTSGGSANATWTNGDTATFSASGVTAGSYAIGLSGTETAGEIVFTSGTATLGGGTLNLSGSGLVGVAGSPVEGIIASPITGSAGLTKFGLGQLDLQGVNTFTGNLTNQAGTLTLDNNQAAGQGAIVLSPNSSVALNSLLSLATVTNNVVFAGNGSTIEIDPGANDTIVLSGVLSGSHPWNANGPGTLILSNANTFGGVLTVAQGTVVAAVDGSLGGTGIGQNVIVSNNATLSFEGPLTYSSDKQITLKGTGVGGGAALNSISGDNTFEGTIILATNSVIGASAGSLSFQGVGQVTGSYNVTITGAGEVDIYTSANNYQNTVVSNGTFGVWDTGSPGTGLVTVNAGSIFTGNSGTAAPGGVSLSGEIFPGEDFNTASFGTAAETWNGGGAYDWTIDDATGLAGSEPGYSTINISGALNISAAHSNPFTIHLMTLDHSFGGPGFAEKFDNTTIYTWTIATASGGIIGFDPSSFVIDASGFENALGNGAFILQQSGNSLVVSFVQKPQITFGPVSQTVNQCDTATFSITATGTPPLQYQWYSNSIAIPSATATNYVIPDVAFADAGIYSVTVSNLSGVTVTNSATLTVANPPPVIVVNPIAVQLNNGSYTLTPSDIVALLAGSGDHCGNSFIASTNVTPSSFDCDNVGPNPVTVMLTDVSNHTSTASVMITVQDLTPPTIVVNPITVTLDATGNYTLTSSNIAALVAGSTDSCPVIAVTNVSQTSFTFCEVGTNIVSVMLRDTNGNTSSSNAQVIVQKPANPPATVYVDANYPVTCGLVAFPNGGGSAQYYYGYNAFNTVQAGINAVATNGSVNVAAGPYSENDTANKPVTLLGANHGVSGCGNRGAESIIGAGGTAMTITTSNVVVDGFELNGAESVQDNGNAGVVIQNNTMNAVAAGVEVTNVTTTANAGLTVQDNCITLSSQLAGGTPTVGIGIAGVSGTLPPLIQSNNIAGSYIGYLLYGLNAGAPTVVQGGSITGVMQGIHVRNLSPLNNVSLSSSTFEVEGATVSGFAGNYPALAGAGVDFQAGVYVYTTGSSTALVTGILTNVIVIGCSNISSDSSGLYFSDFSTGAGLRQQITVQNCNVSSNQNRGVFFSGSNLVATVTASSILGNGYNPYGPRGNPGFGIIARNNALVTISGCLIANPASQTAYTVTALEADADTLPLGPILVVTNCSIVNNNNINGNLAGQSSGIVNASGNWWGTTNDAAIMNLMTGVVDFTPYLDSGANSAPAGAGFQGNFSVLHVTTLGAQTGGGPRVQEGVNGVTGGSPMVIVQPGTYDESVSIGATGLTLEGAANAGIPAWGVRGAESIMSSSSPNGTIQISANNVTVNGMNTEGPGAAYGVNVGVGALNAMIIDTIMNGGAVGAGVFGTATLKFDVASNPANQVGILVNGASAAALIESNNLAGDTVAGIEATNGATVDAGGDCTSSDVTGLGTGSNADGSSAGGNVLTGYGFDNAAPWAIANYNSGAPAVLAYQNIYGATVGDNFASLFTGTILADQAGGLLVQYPANQLFQCSSSVPVGATSLAGFEAQGGVVSATVANVSFSDSIVSNSPNNVVITRTYTVTAACGQSASNNQIITVHNTALPMVTSWPTNRTLDVNGNCEVPIPDLTTQVVGAAVSCSDAIIVTENPVAGTMVSLGTTNVIVTVSDTDGNSISKSVVLTVIDSTPPTEAFVDTNYANLPAGTVVNWPYSGGNGPHYVGCDAFATIQDAVDRVAVGGTVEVAAGTYVEDLTISQPLTLLGPNATNNPNTGIRVPEAVIEPATSGADPFTQDEIIVYVATNHVTIKGFTVDGNNPLLSDGTLIGDVESYASEGIVSYEGVGWITVDNNIVRNTTYTGVDFYNYNNPAATSTNYINCNRFDNLGGTYGYGIGVLIYNNFYSDVANNFMTNVVVGIQTGNFSQSNPGTTQGINNNTISANGVGVFFNLMYDSSTTFTVNNNAIAFAYAAGSPEWDGMLVSSIQSGVSVNIQSNNIACSVTNAGYNEVGYNVWNTPTTGTVLIEGGTISNADYGVWINNFDGYQSVGGSTTATINNVLISGASLAGVYVQDDPRAFANGVVVQGTVTGNTVITGSGIGVLVQGTNAAASVLNNNASITGNAVGISVDTGKALIQNNDLTGNSVAGISVTNNATVDAGNCSGADVTGLGTGSGSMGSSAGGNNLSGYNFGGTGPWAIEDFNSAGGPALYAENDNYGAGVGQSIPSVIKDPNAAVVHYSQGPAVATAPTNVTVVCASEVPVGAMNLSQFLAQGGTYSANTATIAFSDSDSANLVGGTNVITITRTYTVTDTCDEATNCTQTITLNEAPPVVTANTITVALNGNGDYALNAMDVADLFNGSDLCGPAGTNISAVMFNCLNVGTNPVVVTLTNIYGLTSSSTGAVIVQDITPPVVVVNPYSITLGASGAYTLTATDEVAMVAGSSDNCGIASTNFGPANTSFTFCEEGTVVEVPVYMTDIHHNVSAVTNVSVTVNAPVSAPSIVYVDASYPAGCGAVTFPNVDGTGTYYIGYNAFNTIQSGLNAVALGGTVEVAGGTYNESPTINNPVILTSIGGTNAAATIINLPSNPPPTYVSALTINSSSVSIEGFTLVGYDSSGEYEPPTYGEASVNILLNPAFTNIDIGNNVIEVGSISTNVDVYTGSDGFGFETTYNIPSGLLPYGAWAPGTSPAVPLASDLDVHNNVFEPVDVPPAYDTPGNAFFINPAGNFTFVSNTIDGDFEQSTTCATNSLIADNTVIGTATNDESGAFATFGYPDPAIYGGHATFEDNVISNTASGIAVYDSENVTIENNILDGDGVGVSVQDSGFDPVYPAGNTVRIINNSLTNDFIGIFNTSSNSTPVASSNWWGSVSGPADAQNPYGTGSSVSGNVTITSWLANGGNSSAGLGFDPTAPEVYPPTQLVFTMEPGSAGLGSPLSPQPVVTVEDANNNPTPWVDANVTMSISNNATGHGVLTGTTNLASVNGIATYTNLAITVDGGLGDTLEAAALYLTSALSTTIDIANPTPAALSLNPFFARANSGNFTLTVTGSNFVASSTVDWNGTPLTTTYLSSTQLTAAVPGSDITMVGTEPITVVSPMPGGGTSSSLTFLIEPSEPEVVYVDTNYARLPANTLVDWPYTGPGTNIIGYDAFATVQGGVNGVASGGTVNVAAGLYTEEVSISEPMTLLGPNATNNPCMGARVPEAVIEPDYSDPNIYDADAVEMISMASSNVVIKGFTVDGYNPNLTTNIDQSGTDRFNSAIGIADYTGDNSIKIEDNIVRNQSYVGVDLESDGPGSPPATNSYIKCNLLENIDYNAQGFGFGIILYNNYYAEISDNCLTNVAIGVSPQSFWQANPGNSSGQTIANNKVSASLLGIWLNLVYDSGATFQIHDNTSMFMPTNGSILYGPAEWDAFELTSIQSTSGVVVSNNVAIGTVGNAGYDTVGYNIWNTPTTNVVLIEDGSVSNVNYGVWLNNYDGYQQPSTNSPWSVYPATTATINNVIISQASLAGVYVQDDPRASTLGVAQGVQATVIGNTVITGSGIGVLVQGVNAAASVLNNNASITGNTVGISVDTGKALIQNNDLTGNSVAGISVTNNATVDAGDCSGADVTGLGTGSGNNGSSVGGNNLSGYNFNGTGPWAIENFNAANPSVLAEDDNYGAGVGQNIASVITNFNGGMVEYSQGPAVVSPPPNVTVVCASDVPAGATSLGQFLAQGGAYSANMATVGFSDNTNLTGSGVITRTYTVTNTCDEVTNCTQTITVSDTIPPTFTLVPNNITVDTDPGECSKSNVTWIVTASDNCALASLVSIPTNGSTFETGTTTVTNIATDTSGNTTVATFNVTVIATNLPTITCPGVQTNVANATNALAPLPDLTPLVVASDPCGVPVLTQTPVAGTPEGVGSHTVTVWATDQYGNSNSCSTVVVVIYTNAPEITCAPNVTVMTTQDKDPYATGSPTAASTNGPVTLSYVDDDSDLTNCDSTGDILRTWTATDASGNTNVCVQTITVVDTNAPYFTHLPGNITTTNDLGYCSAVVNYMPQAEDPGYFQGFENTNWISNTNSAVTDLDWNDGASHVYRAASGSNGIVSPNGVAYAVIDSTVPQAGPNYSASGAFCNLGGFSSWDYTSLYNSAYSSTFGFGYRVSLDIYINLNDPAVTSATPTTGYGWDLSTAASDDKGNFLSDFIFQTAAYGPGGVAVAADYNSSDSPDARRNDLLTVTNHAVLTKSGWYKFEWNFHPDTNGALAVDMKVRDTNGVVQFAQTLGNPLNAINVDGRPNYTWFVFVFADQLPIADTLFERNEPVISTIPSGTAFPVGALTVTNIAADACGHSTNTIFTVTVNDVQPPTLVTNTLTVRLDASGNYSLSATDIAALVADSGDNCATAITNVSPTSFDCGNVGSNTVIVTLTDVHSNVTTGAATVIVQDSTPPIAVINPLTVILAGGTYSLSASDVAGLVAGSSDNCGIVSTNVVQTTFDCDNVGTNTVSVRLTDVHGNSTTTNATIVVRDTTPPSLSLTPPAPASADANCQAQVPAVAYIVNDSCGPTPMVVQSPSAGTEVGEGTITITVVATDSNHNSTTNTTTFTVRDTTPPVIQWSFTNLVLHTVSYDCQTNMIDVTGTNYIVAYDNCSGTNLTITQSPTNGAVLPEGTNTIIISVADQANNTNYSTNTIVVVDVTPPSANVPVNIVQANDPGQCSALVNFSLLAQTDNCGVSNQVATPPSGSFFDVGTNTVTVVVSDINGNTATNSFTVTVVDGQPPVITNAVNIVRAVDPGQTYATVNFSIGATDNCAVASVMAGWQSSSQSSPGNMVTVSGWQFPIGTNTVTAIATDIHGNTSTNTFTVAVIGLPTITSQPLSRTNNAGTTATFAVGAVSPAPLTYQWFKGNMLLSNGGNISGATNATLSLADVSDTDAGSYSVQVSNFAGTVTSSNATLTVIDGPVIIALTPVSQTNAATTTATFTVSVNGTAPFTYQWTKITATSTNTLVDGGNIIGSTSNVLTITNVLAADQAEYLVTVKNPAGSPTTNGMLYVLDPYIFVQPMSMTNSLGGTVSFSVTAAGTASLGYQWQQYGLDLPGETGNSLTLNNIKDSDAGDYTVVVSNGVGQVISDIATLTITHPPVIAHQPVNTTVNEGQTTTLTVTVNGDSPFMYQWYQNGSPAAGANVSGATTSQLIITGATPLNAGSYYVAITNDVGQTNSIAITLTVVVPPAITNQPVGLTNLAGTTATFIVGASGTSPAYQWYEITATATNSLTDGGNIFGSSSNVLTITNVLGANDGSYFAVATNRAGVAVSSNAVLVVIDPIITNEPASLTVNLGSPATFSVSAYGTSPQYQWYVNGNIIPGANSSTYAIASVADANRGNYTVVVTNIYGVVTSTPAASLTVIDPPVIVGQPRNVIANAGTTATFTVTNTGTAPGYQWYFGNMLLNNGGNITGANSAMLIISNVQDINAGGYSVVISNAAATVTSSNAVLTVIDPPVMAVLLPSSQTNKATTTAQFTVSVTGTAPFAYQWTKITATSTNVLSDGGNIFGSTSNVLTISDVLAADQAKYQVTVSNPAGVVVTNGTLFVVDPAIFVQPVGQTNFLGSMVMFSVTAGGTAPLYYQWFQNGSPLFNANSNVLTFRNIADSAAGTYTVVITNSVGSVTSAPALLVTVSPLITQQPFNVITLQGLTANFSVGVNGQLPFSYQWQFEGTNIAGATNRLLSITNVQSANLGYYQVIVMNPVGTQLSNPATLTYGPAAVMIPMSVNNNGLAVFTVNGVAGYPYTLQGTTNLNLTVWFPVMTNAAPFTFTNQSGYPYEFFRALYQQ